MAVATVSDASAVLQDPRDKLPTIALIRDPTVDNMIIYEEAELVQLKCNKKIRVLYPPSLMKILRGDYGHPNTVLGAVIKMLLWKHIKGRWILKPMYEALIGAQNFHF